MLVPQAGRGRWVGMIHVPRLRGYQATPEGIYVPERGGNVCSLGMGHGNGHGLSKPSGRSPVNRLVMQFDGLVEWLSLGDIWPTYERNVPRSWSFWARPEAKVGASCFIGSIQYNATNRGWQIHTGSNPTYVQFDLTNTSSTGNRLRVHMPIVPEEWVHVAVTYNGSSTPAGVQMYANGVLAPMSVGTDGLTDTIINTQNDWIGLNRTGTGFFAFKGRMFDMSIWDRVLTSTEVKQLAKPVVDILSTSMAADLLNWWPMGAVDSVPYAFDLGPSSQDATTINMVRADNIISDWV